jgi:hypothetical protein
VKIERLRGATSEEKSTLEAALNKYKYQVQELENSRNTIEMEC